VSSPDEPAVRHDENADEPAPSADISPPPARQSATDRIAAQLEALDTLPGRPLTEHADVYQQVHAELQAALGEIDGS
jgi:hypothetical protein